MATATEVRDAHRAVLASAARLVEEVDEVAAGVVLRCFWRAVRVARLSGCPASILPQEAEGLARQLLVARGVRVPQPRHPGSRLGELAS